MKTTLAELYIHSADFVWRLAEYYSHSFFGGFLLTIYAE
jgi:hypothetical protein